MTLREKLIVLRDKAGISQMSLAHQLDVSRQAVSRWESGDTTPSMDKLKALAKIYGVSLDWLCSDSDMADEKPIEVVSPLEENETKNTTVSAKDKRKRKIRFVAIALVVGVITLTCIWIATRSENKEMPGKQFVDIISFEGISPLKWIGAGMLYNMDGLVAEDPDINENDILIWNALHEYNGLYLMSPTFWTETLACSSETMQKYEGWTINDYLEIEKSLDSNQSMIYYMNPENFLVSIGGRYLQKALDLVDASCDFDNEEFISILESAVQAGCYEATYDPNETGQQKVIRGKLICFFSGLMTGQDVAFDREECGQTLSYIGWPTVDGSNGTDIRLTQAVGINKATKNIEGCWEFVKYLLKNPILIDNASGMPTYAPLVSEDLEMLNSGEPKFKTTEEDMEIVINLAKESEQLTYYDEEVMNIILNESSAFIQGNTSASETAKRIQSRVSLYMKEQYE